MGCFDNCQPNQRFTVDKPWRTGGSTTWLCIDWDRRRCFSIRVSEEVKMNDDGSGGEEVLDRIFRGLSEVDDRLDNDVNLVEFSIDGDFISASTDGRDDEVPLPLYCPIEMIPEKYRTREHVVSRDELVEVDRLSASVDLVTYKSKPGSRAVFKYAINGTYVLNNWHELNYWLRLTLTSDGHHSIVPFGHVVTDGQDVPGHSTNVEAVVGFTTVVSPGSTLQDLQTTPSWLFKFGYLNQLLQVVDWLNLTHGIVHHSIDPQILFITETDELQIFNLSGAGRLGLDNSEYMIFGNFDTFWVDLVGVTTTVYEIVTGDTQLAKQVRLDGTISTILDKEWTMNPSVRLDTEVSVYRDAIWSWVRFRSRPENLISHYTQAARPLDDWPQFWKPEITNRDRNGDNHGKEKSIFVWRNALRVLRIKFVEWKRPAHNRIPEGSRVLGDGTLIAQADLSESPRAA